MNLFTEEEIENYLISVHAGIITVGALSVEYHAKVGGKLYEAVMSGFGSIDDPFSIEAVTFDSLKKNVYVFSAAKQYQQVREMSRYIVKANERAKFSEFKKLASSVFEDYNENYLRTEFDTAIGESQNARQWLEIERDADVFPYLTYHTQKDSLVREAHAALDGVTKKVSDPFWNNFMPLNGWNCRCFVTQHVEKEVTDTSKLEIDKNDFPELFRHNPGKTKTVFDPKKHTYFKVGKGDQSLRANNFNLPIP